MDISKLSEQQKSQLLAKARGWRVAGDTIFPDDETIDKIQIFYSMGGNLYLAPNMALAWDIHLWMLNREKITAPVSMLSKQLQYTNWWRTWFPWYDSKAQRLWLDKILSLIIKEEGDDLAAIVDHVINPPSDYPEEK